MLSLQSKLRVFAESSSILYYLQELRFKSPIFLNLIDNHIGDAEIEKLANVLKNNTTLKTLYLDVNRIGPTGGVALANVLNSNTTLRTLKLGVNHIGPTGAEALANALNINTTLRTLDIRLNHLAGKREKGFESRGGVALARMLLINTTLADLSVYGNHLDDETGVAFARALTTNTSLTVLNVAENNLGDKSAIAIADALEKNTTLQTLFIGNNDFGRDGVQALVGIKTVDVKLERAQLEILRNETSIIPIIDYLSSTVNFQLKAWKRSVEGQWQVLFSKKGGADVKKVRDVQTKYFARSKMDDFVSVCRNMIDADYIFNNVIDWSNGMITLSHRDTDGWNLHAFCVFSQRDSGILDQKTFTVKVLCSSLRSVVGAGKMLLTILYTYAREWLRKNKMDVCYIEIDGPIPSAEAFYKKLGFTSQYNDNLYMKVDNSTGVLDDLSLRKRPSEQGGTAKRRRTMANSES